MGKRHHLLALLAACSIALPAMSQTGTGNEGEAKTIKPLNNLEVSINAGSTGVGFDVSSYVHKMVRVRTGFDFMPKVKPTMNFLIEGGRYDNDGNWITTQFGEMANMLENFTGYDTTTSTTRFFRANRSTATTYISTLTSRTSSSATDEWACA